jgi:hypothetical protein
MENKVYCLIGVEYNMGNIPGNIHILGVFTDVNKALEARDKKYKSISFVDIVESNIDQINNEIEDRCLNVC